MRDIFLLRACPTTEERKKNRQIKGMISSSMLILFYTIQHVIPNICTKFQNPRRSMRGDQNVMELAL